MGATGRNGLEHKTGHHLVALYSNVQHGLVGQLLLLRDYSGTPECGTFLPSLCISQSPLPLGWGPCDWVILSGAWMEGTHLVS